MTQPWVAFGPEGYGAGCDWQKPPGGLQKEPTGLPLTGVLGDPPHLW